MYAAEMKRGDAAHACRRMMQTKQYVGCWSGGEMFGKFSVAFDPDGEGFLVGGMSAAPFRWTADDKGHVTLQLPAPYGEVQEIKACYDPETDTMRLSNGATGYRNVKVTSSHPAKELQRTINAEMEHKMEQPRREKNYDRETALEIMRLFLTDFTEEELKHCIDSAYDEKFDIPEITRLKKADGAWYL